MKKKSVISRRTVLLGGGAALVSGVGGVAIPNANAFIWGLLARGLMGFARSTVGRVGTLGVTAAGVSALTRTRAARASAAIAARGARPSRTFFGSIMGGLGHGVGSEIGRYATRKLLDTMDGGFGVVQGEGRASPEYRDRNDAIYGCFPNHGGHSSTIILGYPDFLTLHMLRTAMRTDFSYLGYRSLPYRLTLSLYPIDLEREPQYDEVFVSYRPTVIVTAGSVILIQSRRSRIERRRFCTCTVRDRYTGRERYHGDLPLHPQIY